MFNSIPTVQVSDTTDDDSSNNDGTQKIFIKTYFFSITRYTAPLAGTLTTIPSAADVL